MIQPVNLISPRMNSKGVNGKVKSIKSMPIANRAFEKKVALANAGGVSAIASILTALIARSYTATWKNAGLVGVGAGLITMMFVGPKCLYKAGINTYKDIPA